MTDTAFSKVVLWRLLKWKKEKKIQDYQYYQQKKKQKQKTCHVKGLDTIAMETVTQFLGLSANP